MVLELLPKVFAKLSLWRQNESHRQRMYKKGPGNTYDPLRTQESQSQDPAKIPVDPSSISIESEPDIFFLGGGGLASQNFSQGRSRRSRHVLSRAEAVKKNGRLQLQLKKNFKEKTTHFRSGSGAIGAGTFFPGAGHGVVDGAAHLSASRAVVQNNSGD